MVAASTPLRSTAVPPARRSAAITEALPRRNNRRNNRAWRELSVQELFEACYGADSIAPHMDRVRALGHHGQLAVYQGMQSNVRFSTALTCSQIRTYLQAFAEIMRQTGDSSSMAQQHIAEINIMLVLRHAGKDASRADLAQQEQHRVQTQNDGTLPLTVPETELDSVAHSDTDPWAMGVSTTSAMGSDSDMPADALQRKTWTVGSEVEVYSRSLSLWLAGSIGRVYSDDEGEWLEVNYAYGGYDRHKPQRRTSALLRSPSTNVNTVAADEGEVVDQEDL